MDKKTIAVISLVVAIGLALGFHFHKSQGGKKVEFGKCIQVNEGFYKGLKGIAMQKEGDSITFLAIKDGQMLGGIKDDESNLGGCDEQ